jgi:hypothetical protein
MSEWHEEGGNWYREAGRVRMSVLRPHLAGKSWLWMTTLFDRSWASGDADTAEAGKLAAESAAIALADAILAELAPERDVAEQIATWLQGEGHELLPAQIRAGVWKEKP